MHVRPRRELRSEPSLRRGSSSPIPSPRRGGQPLAAWRAQEALHARELGGARQPGSGCGSHKGDVRERLFLEECKTTEKGSLTIKREWLTKINREAVALRKHPALGFGFSVMPYGTPGEWVAVPVSIFSAFLELARAAGDDLDDPKVRKELEQCLRKIVR